MPLSSVQHAIAEERVPLAEFLARVSKELAANAALLDDCQAAIGALCAEGTPRNVSEALQGLDFVTQTTTELADALRRLSAAADGKACLPTGPLAGIRLSGLRDRLSNVSGAQSQPSPHIELW